MADIAILVVDITGFQPQTNESLKILKVEKSCSCIKQGRYDIGNSLMMHISLKR